MADSKAEKSDEITFSQLFSYDLVEQWYLSQANFLYPSLILLQNPIYFLVTIELFTLLGLVIAFKKKEKRVNSFILAIYPCLFHTSFLVFYWSDSAFILFIAEFICLTSYLIGIFHNIMTLIFEFIIFLHNLYKSIKRDNNVAP